MSQSTVGPILDKTFWQSGSEVVRIGGVALSTPNITPPELHLTPCFSNQASPLGVQTHPYRQVKEDSTNHFSQKLNFSSIEVSSASFWRHQGGVMPLFHCFSHLPTAPHVML